MNSPKLSVLMAVYNAEKYLRSAIESVLNQRFNDFELVIVDDGSSDRSREIIESIEDPRIRTVWNRVNQGVAYVRNQGLRMARGKYIAVLDADDIAHPERLRIQNDFLDSKLGVCLVGSAFEIIDQSGQVVGLHTVPTDPLTIRWKLLFGNVIGHSTVMYRHKDAMAVGAYDQAYPFAEDYDLWIRLVARGQLVQLPEPLAQYRVHSDSTTETIKAIAKERSVLTIVARGIVQLTQSTIDSDVVRTLFRDLGEPASSQVTLRTALGVIETCLSRLLASLDLNPAQREQLIALAIHEMRRVGAKNPAWRKATASAALRTLAAHNPSGFLGKQGLRTLWAALAPASIRRAVRKFRNFGQARGA